MMNIIMLKPTHFRQRFYSRAKPYTVEDVVGKRWIKRKLAVLDTREEMAVAVPVQEGFKNEIPEPPEEGTIESFSKAGISLADQLNIDPEVDPENNGNPNIKELKLMAKAAKITGYSRMSKEQLLGELNGDNNVS